VPLETANTISDLVQSNPAGSDPLAKSADHIRLLKASMKATFPNWTGALVATNAAVDAAASAVANGVPLLSDSGAFFKTNTTDGFVNSLAGDIDVKLQGVVAGTFQRTLSTNFFKWHGPAVFDGEIKGPGITPLGACVLWFDDTLPTDGLWAWANGQVIANANTSCPILLARWGSRFGGNGTTTMGVPDMREVVPIGKSTMGGTARRGLLSWLADAVVNTIGNVFGEGQHVLTVSEMPAHNHSANVSDPGHVHSQSAFAQQLGGLTGAGNGWSNITPISTGSAQTGISVSINNNGSGAAHNTIQPSAVCNYIIRIG
jgi:microcystin-dependent protein